MPLKLLLLITFSNFNIQQNKKKHCKHFGNFFSNLEIGHSYQYMLINTRERSDVEKKLVISKLYNISVIYYITIHYYHLQFIVYYSR